MTPRVLITTASTMAPSAKTPPPTMIGRTDSLMIESAPPGTKVSSTRSSTRGVVTALKPSVVIAASPHVLRSTPTDRFTASTGPTPSTASTGTTKNVAMAHAMPTSRIMSWPSQPSRSASMLSNTPTVAFRIVQPRICGMRLVAARSPKLTFVSRPSSRSLAQAIRPVLKKVVMKKLTR